ncbi:hypothetical protein L1D44_15060 [Shewanella sp. Isolate13]|uniref:hypothetical protein n=1 Tax=Shewanella sp. Isolate13 TaxID=2908531 RepID=UPI001EFCDA2B|nr:hypothetical protein [Shewanella sp. Isolate13]MCG9731117.1 hypothetical protein [Shewanella sp. Isolate13]
MRIRLNKTAVKGASWLFILSHLLFLSGCSHTPSEVTTISLQLPKNIERYKHLAALSAQEGTNLSLDEFDMISSELTVPCAQKYQTLITATVTPFTHHPSAEKVIYFNVIEHTAYVVLAMDEDAWAGISATLAATRPLLTLNLLQFKEIQTVKFQHPQPIFVETSSH